MTAIAVVLGIRLIFFNKKRPICHPGGPRKKKQLKTPEWDEKDIPIEAGFNRILKCFDDDTNLFSFSKFFVLSKGWRFITDHESVEYTNSLFTNQELTGESAGRQIWVYDEEYAKNSKPPSPQIKEGIFDDYINETAQEKHFGDDDKSGAKVQEDWSLVHIPHFTPTNNPNASDLLYHNQV